MNAFLDRLSSTPLVFDGAVGTQLYERGMLYNKCFEEACLSNPALVQEIHRGYLQAGANLITTNTFGANRLRLNVHGLGDKTVLINQAAVKLAREVVRDEAFVGASVGPTGLIIKALNAEEEQQIKNTFLEQCRALADEGIDAFVLETFRQPSELKLAIEAAQEAAQGRIPVLALVSFDAFGTMADGTGPEAIAEQLKNLGVQAIGVNCATGPAGVYEMVTRMQGAKLPLIAQPNAGIPQRIEGRMAYFATPEYFMVYARRLYKAGVNAVGGCCGTTPDHVRKIAQAARMMGAAGNESGGGMRESNPPRIEIETHHTVKATHEKGVLGAKLSTNKFIVSVEVNPPAGLDLERTMAGVKLLKDGGVDVINVADGARATARMGNLALCTRIQEKFDMPTLMHVTTRDRNLLGLVAHLLCSHELGVRNLVVVTGDPPKMGDFPDATAVYDLDSIGLLRLARELNHGVDPGGKLMDHATEFLCATGAEPAAHDYQREIARLKSKCQAGAELIMTQPVYDPAVLDRFLNDVAPLKVPVLVGLLPLASYRNAEFLHNEVPGMAVPEEIRERMRRAGNSDLGRKEGVAIAREMLDAVKHRVQGAYIMPPFGRYQLALDVVNGFI